jgi:hypothetical protein
VKLVGAVVESVLVEPKSPNLSRWVNRLQLLRRLLSVSLVLPFRVVS